MNTVMLANAALASGMFVVVALPGLRKPGAGRWIALIALVAGIDALSTLSPFIWPALDFTGGHWNWSGKLICLGALLLIALVLMATGTLNAREIGLTTKQAPGTKRAWLWGILPYFILLAVLTATLFADDKPPTLETLGYQATMPGLTEELSYRGLLLALFDRMFAGRLKFFGADIGYGAFAVSLVFGGMHAVQFGHDFALHFSPEDFVLTGIIGFFLVWVRARTQSLVAPILTHNITNLIFESVPKLL